MRDYKLIVTYNGKCFDIPFIEYYFGIKLDCAQIDLRYVLSSLGIKGGLKGCEKRLGIQRPPGMEELDGFFA
ncbi:MAG: exonuclease, partial [Acidobacteria bacterium]|nr:exonuclease [Acidobacteriota bacterium]